MNESIPMMPALWCPFPAHINPYAAQVQHDTLRWLEQWGLGTGDHSVPEVGMLAARLHPTAPRSLLQLTSDWYAWIFAQDDHHDESAAWADPRTLQTKHTRFLDVLRGDAPHEHDEPTVHALRDLRDRLRIAASQRWMHTFIYKVGEYFNATLWEALNRAQGVTPTLATYTMLRPITAGLELEQVLLDVVEHHAVPNVARYAACVRHAAHHADQAVCWGNDLVSWPKELQQGDVHNLVLVLQHEQHCSLPQAIEHARALHDAAVAACAAAITHLASAAQHDPCLRHYLHLVQCRVSGHIAWVGESVRYHHVLASQA